MSVLKTHKVGDHVTLQINRNGTAMSVGVTLQQPLKEGGNPSIGIGVLDSFAIPFEIDIDLNNVGGPSAGLAFTLGIIDKLTDGNLTGGLTIAKLRAVLRQDVQCRIAGAIVGGIDRPVLVGLGDQGVELFGEKAFAVVRRQQDGHPLGCGRRTLPLWG